MFSFCKGLQSVGSWHAFIVSSTKLQPEGWREEKENPNLHRVIRNFRFCQPKVSEDLFSALNVFEALIVPSINSFLGCTCASPREWVNMFHSLRAPQTHWTAHVQRKWILSSPRLLWLAKPGFCCNGWNCDQEPVSLPLHPPQQSPC